MITPAIVTLSFDKITLDDLLKTKPSGGGSSKARPIGIPEGSSFKPSVDRGPGKSTFYSEIDLLKPIRWSPEKRMRLKLDMYNAGLYGKEDPPNVATWDSASRAAYRKLLSDANYNGTSATDLLNYYKTSPLVDPDKLGGGGSKRAPLSYKVENPDDLRELARGVSAAKNGRALPPEQIESLVRAWQAEEARTAQQSYAGGGAVAKAPDAEAFFGREAAKKDPLGAGAHDLAMAAKSIVDILGGLDGQS